MSPNYNRVRTPDHHGGGYKGGSGGGGGYYNKNQPTKHQGSHSKLPHGLTVQELKEMTRARLASETEVGGPEGSVDQQSVHSADASSKGSDQYSLGRASSLAQSNESVTRNLVQSNESIRRDYSNQGMGNAQGYQGQHAMQHMQPPNPPQYTYPMHPSPVFGGPGPGPNPNQQFIGNPQQLPDPRQSSPAFGLNSRSSMGETWETASSASNPGGGAAMQFSSPISDSNAMNFNRTRCFSAGATMPSSFEQHQASYYENVPLTGGANRQRCATVSPPGMSRLHEDRPFLFSTDEKERLAIPPLSEPRLRLHSTGGLNTHSAISSFSSRLGGGGAFVPIGGKSNEQFLPQSPPPLNIHRSKFGVNDRTISTGSAASTHGDLPSSMAEAVLESITSTNAPLGGAVIGGASPFRSSKQEIVGKSPFRRSLETEDTSATFLDSLMQESSGSASFYSSGESRNIFTTERGGDRMLLGTHSWGGAEDDASQSNTIGLSHDFGNLLNLDNGPALRGRAATEPSWFGGNDPLLVSRIDPEHNADDTKPPPRVTSLVDTKAPTFNMHGQQRS